jgi:hypothetical protein
VANRLHGEVTNRLHGEVTNRLHGLHCEHTDSEVVYCCCVWIS